MYGFNGLYFGGMWLWWIVFIAIAAGVIWSVRQVSMRSGNTPSESPEQILKRRYANGEIDDNQYEHMLAHIKK